MTILGCRKHLLPMTTIFCNESSNFASTGPSQLGVGSPPKTSELNMLISALGRTFEESSFQHIMSSKAHI